MRSGLSTLVPSHSPSIKPSLSIMESRPSLRGRPRCGKIVCGLLSDPDSHSARIPIRPGFPSGRVLIRSRYDRSHATSSSRKHSEPKQAAALPAGFSAPGRPGGCWRNSGRLRRTSARIPVRRGSRTGKGGSAGQCCGRAPGQHVGCRDGCCFDRHPRSGCLQRSSDRDGYPQPI
jgi:hypothetical protein